MFRFTIRDVLWLTVVVALAVTWWLDRKSLESKSAARFGLPKSSAQSRWPYRRRWS